VKRTLGALRFFKSSDQSARSDATGFKGFYYHFLDRDSGARVWDSELSMVDTALLLAGALVSGRYFDDDAPQEAELRRLVDDLYARVDWQWATGNSETLRQGWKPECGFLHYGWEGYNEAIILYVLALGSDTSARERLLSRVDRDVPVGESVRVRFFVRRTAVRPSVFACVDRLPRDSRSVHAGEALRLFREQPARDVDPARIREAQPKRIRGLCR
jgi:hypothetical protein